METDLSPLLGLLKEVPGYARVRDQLLSGEGGRVAVAEGARPFLLAGLHRDLAAPMLVVAPRPEAARSLYEGLRGWCPPGSPLFLFPETDALPYERLSPDPTTTQERLRALGALARRGGPAPLLVASAWAAASLTLSPQAFQKASLLLQPGTSLSPTQLIEQCLSAGYDMAPTVEVPGTLSRRGGIVDIFPPLSPHPFRIEFLGNRIESLRAFDPASQRSLAPAPEAQLSPAREALLPSPLPPLPLDSLSPEDRERFQEELERLRQGERFPGWEFYAPLFQDSCLLDYLPPEGVQVWLAPELILSPLKEWEERLGRLRQEKIEAGELPSQFPTPYLSRGELEGRGAGRRSLKVGWGGEELPFSSAPSFSGQWPRFLQDLKARLAQRHRVVLVSQQPQRLSEMLGEEGILVSPASPPHPGEVALLQGPLPQGWLLHSPPVALFTDAEVLGITREPRRAKRHPVPQPPPFFHFSPGDFVVHIEHGIARFSGLTRLAQNGEEKDYLVLEYAEGDRLFVPTDQAERVSRYLGAGVPPALSRLGTVEWQRTKARVKQAAQDIARELLELYASRQVLPGHPFPPDTPWQQELEASFSYQETPDQAEAVRQVKADMELPHPMDRLVCGDVGYGKTEVALRAAFKSVLDGKQVAVLVPTTILAQQHFSTFTQRLSSFPARVEVLSRFRTEKEQQAALKGLQEGEVDICIGTHRLLQKDVAFKDLGLVIVDEEQRFGVKHKERLKRMRQEVDVLTLSATPIPRTLYMSLAGVRDMSLMETPPEERQPVKTYVAEYQPSLIREAILRELERGGQVFFVHNRVETIARAAWELEALVPEGRILIGHGQMEEAALEQVMARFAQGQGDVLVCTTIIESGLDMPNVNTLIVDEADRLGLTQLYQLRGRVGRGAARAYAYFLYRRGKRLTPQAEQRLKTIYEATELGAGFYIAMRDLEIRGAGNLLGSEQSGHIGAVGFDLYTRLLSEAVAELKASRESRVKSQESKPLAPDSRLPAPDSQPLTSAPSISLPLPTFLPPDYIPHLDTRLTLYGRLARSPDPQQLEELAREMAERFGPLPPEARNLLFIVRLKGLARGAGLEAVATEDEEIVLRLREGKRVDPAHLPPLPGVRPGVSQVRIELRKGWQQTLEQVLERMAGGLPLSLDGRGSG